MADNFYNPFNEVFESEDHPHSRTLNTSFFEKLSDAYGVFAGVFYYKEQEELKKNHIGLFDYFTLGIPYFIDKVTAWAWENTSKQVLKMLLIFPFSVTSVVLNIAREATAAVLTIATSPITLIVSLFSWAIFKPMKEAVLNIKIKSPTSSSTDKTVREYLKENNLPENLRGFNWIVDNYTPEYLGNLKYKMTLHLKELPSSKSSLPTITIVYDKKIKSSFVSAQKLGLSLFSPASTLRPTDQQKTATVTQPPPSLQS